ncbi:hypothetical protein DXG01_011470 [Tephrocybe rancida]|nr:hypothetical protein DXG01_011470 [Tephrocybe rancida]
MAKKKPAASKNSAKALKKAKAAQKIERKETKNIKKTKGKGKDDDDDDDLEGILEKMRREWEEAHTVTEELVEGPPSRRANATLTPCPNGNHLWCIGGELFSDDGKAYFYNDVFRYSPDKVHGVQHMLQSGPRSAHAVVATPSGGGKIFLFGGEFSSLHQNTFHHYRDFWVFDIATHSWDRIDTKVRPSARSGHRMAIFKYYIVLFGGFYDPGITTRYLNDLWVFDTQEYSWRQIELRDTDQRPSPRSGFSFLPSPDGILLHGGYCKEYAKGKRPVGVILEDTWFLHLTIPTVTEPMSGKSKVSAPTLTAKWERRKRPSYAPALRSGCTMTLWAAKSTGILFGGVTDEDRHEETLESVFWNDLYGYQIPGKGRWVSMALKRPKKKGGSQKKKAAPVPQQKYSRDEEESDMDVDTEGDEDGPASPISKKPLNKPEAPPPLPEEPEIDPDDPNFTIPLPRYNTMLAVLRNTLYIYGGIFEKGSREYTLDDFHSLQLDKMERYVCLKESGVTIAEGDESSSDDDDDDDDDDADDDADDDDDSEDDDGQNGDGGDEDEDGDGDGAGEDEAGGDEGDEPEVNVDEGEDIILKQTLEEKDDLRNKATAFMGVAKDATRSAEDVISTPLPGETLAMFYARSREHWSGKAHGSSDNRGKQLRRDGFALAEERYASYKPILEEVEKILAEAGLDEEEMRRGAAAGPLSPASLPDEMWMLVFQTFDSSSDLLKVVKTCKFLYSLAIRALYRDVQWNGPFLFASNVPFWKRHGRSMELAPTALTVTISLVNSNAFTRYDPAVGIVEEDGSWTSTPESRATQMIYVLDEVPELKKISFFASQRMYTAITNRISGFTAMRDLVFHLCELPDTVFPTIKLLPRLRSLSLQYCTLPTMDLEPDTSFSELPITELTLWFLKGDSEAARNSNYVYTMYLCTARHLRKLNIDWTPLTGRFLSQNIPGVTFAPLTRLVDLMLRLPSLKSGEETASTWGECLEEFLVGCPNIQHFACVNMRGKFRLSDAVLTNLTSYRGSMSPGLSLLKSRPTIDSIEMTDNDRKCSEISKTLERIARSVPRLGTLSFRMYVWDKEILYVLVSLFADLRNIRITFENGGLHEVRSGLNSVVELQADRRVLF